MEGKRNSMKNKGAVEAQLSEISQFLTCRAQVSQKMKFRESMSPLSPCSHPRGKRKSVTRPVGAKSVPASEQSPGPAQITGVVWLACSLKAKDTNQSWAWFWRGDWVRGINFREESMANTWMNSRLRQSPGLNSPVIADPPPSLSKAK